MIRLILGLISLSPLFAAEMAEILFPQIGQQGTTVELTLLGEDLFDPEEILFYQSGIKTVSIEPLSETVNFRLPNSLRETESGTALKLTLKIASDAPLGSHPFRIRTRDNLSELVRFFVTAHPVVFEEDPFGKTNDLSENAQVVPINSSVVGYLPIGPPQDDDWFKVTLKKNQRLTVQALAARLGTLHRSGMNDPSLAIIGPDEKQLASNDDNARTSQDPIVSIVAKEAGVHLIHMRQQMDYETGLRHYSLDITDSPAPKAVYPKTPGFSGAIESEGEIDWHTFAAKAGEKFRIRTYAATVGSELDPQIVIKSPDGEILHEEDDSSWQAHDMIGHSSRWQVRARLDPILIFEPERDGDYLIGISDKRREFSPAHRYHIECQKHLNGAYIYFGPYPSRPHTMRDRIVINRGSSASRPALIMPRLGNGYTGNLRLRALNLPKGVTFDAPVFTSKENSVPIIFHADKATKRQAVLIDLVAEPVEKTPFISSYVQNIPATNRRGDFAMQFTMVHKVALAVVDEAPFSITAEQPESSLAQKGQLKLKLHVQRRSDFKGAIYCEADWLPGNVNKQAPLIIPADATTANYQLEAKANAQTGTFPVSITARENKGYNVTYGTGFHYVSTPFVDLEITAPFLEVQMGRAAIERGKKGTLAANVEHLRPFEGKATLTLGNLPFGVQQIKPYPQLTSEDKKVTFHLNVSTDCLVNQYKDIFCKINGPNINQHSGNGTLRVDPIRK